MTSQLEGREMEHTPGPWVATFYDETVAKHPHWCVDCNPPDVLTVAVLYRDHSGYGTSAEAEANAKLIAAAPKLLAACREALVALETFGQLAATPERIAAQDRAKAMLRPAIAAAEGRP